MKLKNFNEIYENYSWQYAKKEWFDTGKISKDDFDDLLDIAKTKNINDVYRLCEFFYENPITHQIEKIRSYYDIFKQGLNKNIIKGNDRNIYNKRVYKDFDEFEDKMDDVNYEIEVFGRKVSPVNQSNVRKESALIYEDVDWEIYEIFGFDASRYFGRGTRWCISANSYAGLNSFEHHDNQKNIYFIISKKLRFDNYRKIAVLVDNYGKFEYSDVNDDFVTKNTVENKTGINLDDVNW